MADEQPILPDLPAGPTDHTSVSLLERARRHEDDAWARLVRLYSPLVYSWMIKANLSREDAQDLLQDVFAAVAKNLGSFRRDRPGDTFRGWLRVIARNKILHHLRDGRGKPQAAGGTSAQIRLNELEDGEPTEDFPEAQEQSSVFHRGLEMIRAEFEDHTWRAFWQAAVEGRATADIAADLNMTPGAVRQAKYKVLRKLRTEFGDLLD